ncbi:aspartate dehydrogenase [Enemella dayhoffiae]|uniref:L-aspartate dehydrogenase n=1 Tax=Enemella dayhoffiae TaxID=2016507 RepID=A0A255GRY5_9ACTN|nr:aspartate dehydrogenase domain-containing protein [Enemella dayhoffiae]OYO18331.1 aspartate dehydrogenase [Enemella dayhoffiae]
MSESLRVVIVGHGVIGSTVAARVATGEVVGAELVAVVNRSPVANPPAQQLDLPAALKGADLVVECAGQPVVHEIVDQVVSAGVDLLVTSVGALLDPELSGRLPQLGPGRVLATHGAVGGLDLLAAASRGGGFESVLMRTTKQPGALIRQWMEPEQIELLRTATEPVLVFSGTPNEAVALFPESLNIVAGVATAIGSVEPLRVELYADPAATMSTHRIQARAQLGEYLFEVRNFPSRDNPRSSAITPFSVLHSISGLTQHPPAVL